MNSKDHLYFRLILNIDIIELTRSKCWLYFLTDSQTKLNYLNKMITDIHPRALISGAAVDTWCPHSPITVTTAQGWPFGKVM